MTSLIPEHKCICDECRVNSKESKPTGKGSKTIFRLLNASGKTTDKYIVDDCLLKRAARDEKCDYLFNVHETDTVFLVECKGSDVLKAVNQINSTLDILNKCLTGKIVKGRIISTRVYAPDIRRREYSNLRFRLLGNLITQNRILEEII